MHSCTGGTDPAYIALESETVSNIDKNFFISAKLHLETVIAFSLCFRELINMFIMRFLRLFMNISGGRHSVFLSE